MKDREVKDREKRLFKNKYCVYYIEKFERKEMKKIRPIKNTWSDWLINYIPDPIRKSVGGFKDKIVSLFKTSTPKQAVHCV